MASARGVRNQPVDLLSILDLSSFLQFGFSRVGYNTRVGVIGLIQHQASVTVEPCLVVTPHLQSPFHVVTIDVHQHFSLQHCSKLNVNAQLKYQERIQVLGSTFL